MLALLQELRQYRDHHCSIIFKSVYTALKKLLCLYFELGMELAITKFYIFYILLYFVLEFAVI